MSTILEKMDKLSRGKGRKAFNSYIVKQTQHYQKKFGFDIGTGEHATWNNEADAFKHAYMQWALGYYAGSDVAKKLGDMHEDETPLADGGERNMDLWNNAIGREIAEEMKTNPKENVFESASDVAARKIFEKMKKGELITDKNDSRKYENMDLERVSESDRVYYKDEFKGKMNDKIKEQYLNQAIENDWKIPEKKELDSKVQSGEMIYVDDYTKSDGTKVSGYYRKRP